MKKTGKSKQKIDACYCYEPKDSPWKLVEIGATPKRLLTEFAHTHYPRPRIFIDGDGREELEKLFRKVKAGRVKTITVFELSDIVLFGKHLRELLRFLGKHKVVFKSLRELIDTSTDIFRFNSHFPLLNGEEDIEADHSVRCLKSRMGDSGDFFAPECSLN